MPELHDYTKELGISLSKEMFESFEKYAEILSEWNNKISLTAITDKDGVVLKHFADSLSILRYIPEGAESLIDVGSGAGFPGLAIAIARPEMRVTLIESVGKKAEFLKHCAKELNLKKVEVIAARAEEIGQDKRYREKYDVATGRAVAYLPILTEYTLPLIKIGGILIAQKNNDTKEQNESKNAVSLLGGMIKSVNGVPLPFENTRVIIIIEKIHNTPEEFPRSVGIPRQEPL